MKKALKVLLIVFVILLSLIAFHTLNFYYPNNIIRRTLTGISLVLTPILIALVIVYLVNPVTDWLIRKKVKKELAILLTIVLVLIILVGLVYFVVAFFVKQGYELINTIINTNFIDNIRNWFASHGLENIFEYIENFIVNFNYEDLLISGSSSIFSALVSLATTIILVPLFLWHILNNKDTLFGKISDNLPENWKKHVIPIAAKSDDVVAGYFRSKIISIFLLFILFTILYIILGLPIGYVIFFAALIALLDLIPYIGPTVGLLVPIVYIFSVNGVNILYQSNLAVNAISANAILILVNFLIQLVQGNYIVPKLAGKEMNIHPALILIFMLLFGSILGIWGVVLSIPLGGIMIVIWNYLKDYGFMDIKPLQKEIVEEEVKEE